MDLIQKILIEAGRKDLAQKYYQKFAQTELNANELIEKIESAIKSIFPDSYVKVALWEMLGVTSISVKFAIGKDKSEWTNGYIENDPMHHVISVDGEIGKDGKLPEKLSIKLSIGGSIMIKPVNNPHLAYERIKIGFRNATLEPNKIPDYFKKYFQKAKQIAKQNADKCYEKDAKLINSKV